MFVAGEEIITSASEADSNWYCDPEAAHAVLIGLNRVITLLPSETCLESSLSWVCNVLLSNVMMCDIHAQLNVARWVSTYHYRFECAVASIYIALNYILFYYSAQS